MSEWKLVLENEEELIALHNIIMEAKFSPNPQDSRLGASPFTAVLAERGLETLIKVQSKKNPTKNDSWSKWLEGKKEWIWRRSLSYLLKHSPFRWETMEEETKYEYIRWVFSPYKPSEKDIRDFIKEYESYNEINSKSIRSSNIRGFGQATDEMLDCLEERLDTTLPKDYKQFLRKYNGGTVVVHYLTFLVEGINEVIPLEVLFGIDVENKYSLNYWNRSNDEFPPNYLAIGEVGNGGKLLLGNGNNKGIFYWNNMFRESPLVEEGVYKVADNFDAFLDGLKKFNSNLGIV
ncbi:SMI1/KNR4 family protein [Paenibacillus alba]|uniref:SMI1/KNR4 family protein n=1 Tax=Paenibacillus alba TaxID=1197127 RepID=UPI0015670FC9|nr:SMI1/KNR4 family protein [Paenibacillus alba]NQX64612.1 SMI1/KNR4 family protein [Paenibacillus alba]